MSTHPLAAPASIWGKRLLLLASPQKTKGAFCSTGPAASHGPLSSAAWVCQDEVHLQKQVVLYILEEVRFPGGFVGQ